MAREGTLKLRWRSDAGNDPARSLLAHAGLPPDLITLLATAAPAVDALRSVAEDQGVATRDRLNSLIAQLISSGCLTLTVGEGTEPWLTVEPLTPAFEVDVMSIGAGVVDNTERLQLSRFAYLRSLDGSLVLECPLALARVRLSDPSIAALIAQLANGATVSDFAHDDRAASGDQIFLGLLRLCGFLDHATDEGSSVDSDDTMRQWEFADLLFHSRSRLGRHDQPMGGTFRFADELPPPPVLAIRPWPTTIPLMRPQRAPVLDHGLIPTLERRRSVREQSQVAISLNELGEFLFHAARVRRFLPGPHGLTLSSRPYPSGGASYELEIYLTIDRCLGLAPGFYYYDAAAHGLAPICPPTEDTRHLLLGAYTSCGGTCYPQVLISIASRFSRISWKYTGIAYATTLKNVGALYTTFYLVGTAMGLAPCALGLGDSERFSKVTGTDRWTEPLVGEFMLGGKAMGVQA